MLTYNTNGKAHVFIITRGEFKIVWQRLQLFANNCYICTLFYTLHLEIIFDFDNMIDGIC